MKMPSEAHAYLLDVASKGHEFTHNQVFPDDAAKEGLVIGRGRDFEYPIMVLDPNGAPTIAGRAALRLVGLNQPDGSTHLFVRTRLDWTVGDSPNNGVVVSSTFPGRVNYDGDYSSFARYVIDDRGASRLNEHVRKGTSDDYIDSRRYYKAGWEQTYPQWFADCFAGTAGEQKSYHRQAVRDAQGKLPALLGMLSTTSRGIVQPKELPDLAEWVSQL